MGIWLDKPLKIPSSFYDAVHSGRYSKQFNFDKYTFNRYVEYKDNGLIRYYESEDVVITINLSKPLEDVHECVGLHFVSSNYLKDMLAKGARLITDTGIYLKQSNICKDSVYYRDNNKYYGLDITSNRYIEVLVKSNSSYITISNNNNTCYITPDTMARKVRKEELKELKGKYALEHAINPMSSVPRAAYLHNSDASLRQDWKKILEDNRHLQRILTEEKSEYSKWSTAHVLQQYLFNEYLKAVIVHSVEYIKHVP